MGQMIISPPFFQLGFGDKNGVYSRHRSRSVARGSVSEACGPVSEGRGLGGVQGGVEGVTGRVMSAGAVG